MTHELTRVKLLRVQHLELQQKQPEASLNFREHSLNIIFQKG